MSVENVEKKYYVYDINGKLPRSVLAVYILQGGSLGGAVTFQKKDLVVRARLGTAQRWIIAL